MARQAKPIILINTGHIYGSAKIAGSELDIKPNHITVSILRNTTCCNLLFEYYDASKKDYYKQKKQELTGFVFKKREVKRKVILLNTGKVYDSCNEISLAANITAGNIIRVIKEKKPCKGLFFEYYDESKKDYYEARRKEILNYNPKDNKQVKRRYPRWTDKPEKGKISAYYGEREELTKQQEKEMMAEAEKRSAKFQRNYHKYDIIDIYSVNY